MIGIIKYFLLTPFHSNGNKLDFDNLYDIFLMQKTANLLILMQHLFKFDIQAAIKCAQKIDQRQIPSDVARWGSF